ncbi:MAG TPA: alanine racemase [Solirubrobacteraceae bacterium]|nr:alanine racemase [Solirubrobacteraceae bacterium]
MALRALARVNLAAIERNVSRLRAELVGGAGLCAVVKADGYGHGAAPAARAALAGGARSLAVATAEEAASLRGARIEAPVLVMGAVSDEELPVVLGAGAEVVAWSDRFVGALMSARERVGPAAAEPVRVHVKLDTGMGRLGTRVFDEAIRVAERVTDAGPGIELAGAMTHFASADEDPEFTALQLSRFEPFVAALRERRPGIVAHAANSAATLRLSASHLDLVRCGIAVYGCDPMNDDPSLHGLEPALELTSYVAALKAAAPGESAGYGRRWVAHTETWLATVPVGYADGIRRALTNNCEVLISGRRYPLVGTVSMDNITVDVGAPDAVRCGDLVTIIGSDGSEHVTAEELARRIGTISYEITCGVSSRVPRTYHRDGEPA